MERQSELYFGQTAEIFTILGEFEMQANRLRFNFETWASLESFQIGDLPVARLRRDFVLLDDALETFKSDNAAVLQSISETALNIASVGGRGWNLDYFYISTVSKILLITAQNPANLEKKTITKPGIAFDETISANLDLIAAAIGITWAFGKANDDFLNQMTASESFAKFIK